jgi:hypothetical protein
MKKLLSVSAVYFLFAFGAVSSVAQSPQVGGAEAKRFGGAWRLAWLEQPGPDGKPHRIECCGMLVYTPDGHMSVQVMEREPQPSATAGQDQSSAPEQYSQGGYEASYGSYAVDEHAHTFTFHVEGALVRNLIGKDLPRSYEFSGNQLIVKSTRADEHWRVAWERY